MSSNRSLLLSQVPVTFLPRDRGDYAQFWDLECHPLSEPQQKTRIRFQLCGTVRIYLLMTNSTDFSNAGKFILPNLRPHFLSVSYLSVILGYCTVNIFLTLKIALILAQCSH